MTINHINLPVSNVKRVSEFFETYLAFTIAEVKGDYAIAVLKNESNFILVIMPLKANDVYPDAFHIGFMLDSIEDVDALHKKLSEGGINLSQSPKKIRDSYGFYFYFDKIFIEIAYQFT